MKYFQPLPIENFIIAIINEDREVSKIMENWNIERDEVIQIIINHFKSLGIYVAYPLEYADVLRKNISFQLHHNPNLKARMAAIAREIERVKTKHSRHAG